MARSAAQKYEAPRVIRLDDTAAGGFECANGEVPGGPGCTGGSYPKGDYCGTGNSAVINLCVNGPSVTF